MSDSWPWCGRCGDVAYFPWLGGAHTCVLPTIEDGDNESASTSRNWEHLGPRPVEDDEARLLWDYRFFQQKLADALTGDVWRISGQLDIGIWDALFTVAHEHPNPSPESIQAAWNELENYLTNSYEHLFV